MEYGKSSHWDVTRLWGEIRKVLKGIEDTQLAGIGVDAWGVDYALLGERGELVQNPIHYRDVRNVSAMIDMLAEKYAAERSAIATDVIAMLQDLADKGFLTEAREKTS